VVVVGGGFGGLTLVRELARARRRDRLRARITLVDRHNHHTFQPLLYQVATAGLQPQDVGISLRAILRRHGVETRLG
jgi:NADH:ubiquinone reductase (H+-translocating)